jgi:Kef-type K+ transport system membrane component KefB
MSNLLIASVLAGLILIAGTISIELSISAAIIETVFGALAANLFQVRTMPWIAFLGSLGSILLAFLAGTEVNTDLLRKNIKQSILIGGLAFLTPLVAGFGFSYFVVHWSFPASKIAGLALSATSLAVVYTVLAETGLSRTSFGKMLMAATFVTDLLTATTLSLISLQGNLYTILFYTFSLLLLLFFPSMLKRFSRKYANKLIEPEIKLLFLLFFITMLLGELGGSQAILPIFVLGLLLSEFFQGHEPLLQKLRAIAFGLITPFFFLKSGLNISLASLIASWWVIGAFLAVKVLAKMFVTYPLARLLVPGDAKAFFSLLMSTDLTFGTIVSVYGLGTNAIDQTQFSILITAIILSAVIPTIIAQRFFSPKTALVEQEVIISQGDEGNRSTIAPL